LPIHRRTGNQLTAANNNAAKSRRFMSTLLSQAPGVCLRLLWRANATRTIVNCPCSCFARSQQRDQQHRDPLQVHEDVDALDDTSPRRQQLLPPSVATFRAAGETLSLVKPVEDTSALLVQLLTEQVLTDLYRMVIESAVSEQLARIAAIRLAGDNARALLDDLTTQYNVASQHAVTQSLLEIVSGTVQFWSR
jgi:ATP synthase